MHRLSRHHDVPTVSVFIYMGINESMCVKHCFVNVCVGTRGKISPTRASPTPISRHCDNSDKQCVLRVLVVVVFMCVIHCFLTVCYVGMNVCYGTS